MADHAMVESAVITLQGYHLEKECRFFFFFFNISYLVVITVYRAHRSNLVVFTSARIQMWGIKQGKDNGVADKVI